MSTVIILDKDSRFRNPFGRDGDKLFTWLLEQDDLRRLYKWLSTNGYTFEVGFPKNSYMLDVYEKANKYPLRREPIYVFGSNLEGIHGAGAAKFARDHRGAVLGTGVGKTGNAYALPTKDTPYDTLPLEKITDYIHQFIYYVKDHPKDHFYVTRVGCKLAGYRDSQMAKIFRDVLSPLNPPLTNIHIPYHWTAYIKDRIIVSGCRSFRDPEHETMIEAGLKKFPKMERMIVGGAWGIDHLAEKIAVKGNIPFTRFPAWWERYGKAAGYLRNEAMLNESSGVVAIWDGESKGTNAMIQLANQAHVDLYLSLVKPPEES